MRCTFKTVFYVNGSKERNGIVPIMGRVTINGTIAQFSCKQSVTKAIWDAKGNRAIGKSKEAKEVNFVLDNIKAQIAKHYQRLSDREAFVTAEMVRNAYQGIGTEYETLLRAFDKENAAFAKRVDKDRAKTTYNKYLTVRKYVAEFIKYQYKRSDMSMNELTEEFIHDYCGNATAQYYRNIKRETERLQNCMKLLQSDVEEAERLLKQTKSEINTEKLQAAKTEAKTALGSKIGSLLGSGKLKEVEQHNRKLCELVADREQYIDELHEKVQRMEDSHSKQLDEMQRKHQSEVANLESKHCTEVTMLNDLIRKANRWFPMLEARLQMEDLCRKIGFTIEQIGVLLTGKALNFSGSLYSEEHRRKFNVENAEIKVFSDSTKPNQLFLYINRQPIGDWFKEQWDNLKLRLSSQRKGVRL